MKTLKYLFVILQIFVIFHMQAQDTISLDEKVMTATSLLPTSDITTDIFYNQVPEYFPFRFLDGINMGDSVYLDKERFKFSYGMLSQAHLDSFPGIAIDSLWRRADSLANEDAIHLGAMYFDYHKLRDKSLDSTVGWLSWDSTYFHDQSPPDSTLYEQSCFYGVAGMTKVVAGPWVTFYLDSSLMFTNIGYDTASLEIDYDDGSGWQDLNLNQYVDVNYSVLDSFKQVRMRMKDTLGQWLYAKTPIFVIAYAQNSGHDFPINPDGVIRMGQTYTFDPDIPCCGVNMENERLKDLCQIRRDTPDSLGRFVAMKNGVEIFYWLNDHCDTIPCHRKPLIVVEGFDPFEKYDYNLLLGVGGEEEEEGLLVGLYNMERSLSEYINLDGYDLYFINFGFENNTDSIQVNAEWLRQAIDTINSLKASCGSIEENVVIGASMGGLVGRWALSDMEAAGEDHETELFVSFDSPMKGANLPIGFQAMIYDLYNTKVFGNKLGGRIPSLAAGYNAFQTPAAKQMLYYNRFASGNNITTNASVLRQYNSTFVSQFEQKDLSIPHLALSNGSILGEAQTFNEGKHLVNTDLHLGAVTTAINSMVLNNNGLCPELFLSHDQKWLLSTAEEANSMSEAGVHIWLDMWATPGKSSDNKVFNKFLFQNMGVIPIFASWGYYKVDNLIEIDNAPGGTSTFENTEGGGQVGFSFEFTDNNYCFVPTPSSLGIDLPSNLNTNLEDVDYVLDNNNTVVREYRGAVIPNGENQTSTTNQEHVTLDRHSAAWWRYHTESRGLADTSGNPITNLDQTFHFGDGPMRAPDSLDPSNLIPRQMRNFIDHSFTVGANGSLWVGRSQNIGFVPDPGLPDNEADSFVLTIIWGICDSTQTIAHIDSASSLVLGSSVSNQFGIVNIEDNSQLHVWNHGLIDLVYNSKLVITPDARLWLHPGANAYLDNASKLIIEPGAQMRIDSGASVFLDNASQIIVRAGGQLTIPSHAFVELKGQSQIILEDEAEIFIDSLGRANLHGGSQIVCLPISTIRLTDSSKILLDGESSFHIDGNFITEGDVEIDAPNGYLDFYAENFVNRNIGGNFRMNGSARNNLLIRFHDFSYGLNVNTHNLELYNGKVLVAEEQGKIWTNGLGPNGEYIMHNIHFLGQGDIAGGGSPYYAYGQDRALSLNEVQKLDVRDCIFENVSTGIFLENSTNTSYQVLNSSFKDVFTGIDASFTNHMLIEQCKFINPQVELQQATAGISLKAVENVDIRETDIHRFRCGIRENHSSTNTTVNLRKCTEIVGCHIGVYGDSTLLHMNRSGLFYNSFGVAGYDMELDIASTGISDDKNVYVQCETSGMQYITSSDDDVDTIDGPPVVDPPYTGANEFCGWFFSIENSGNVPSGDIAAENNYWSPDNLVYNGNYIINYIGPGPAKAQYILDRPHFPLSQDPVPGDCAPSGGGGEPIISTSSESQPARINIYPNPAEHQLHINMPQKMNVMAYSTDGQKIYEQRMSDGETINTVHWQPGLYIVRVGTEYFKIIKQ